MSVSPEPQGKANKNQQAIASLILGVLSIVFAPFNLAPGLIGTVGCVGVIAALLALLAGVLGLRAAQGLAGQGRKLAVAGLATGALGLLAFFVLFIPGVLGPMRQMDQAIATSQAAATPQSFKDGGIQLTYPGGWQIVNISQQDFCKQPGVECLVAIRHPSGDGTNINLMRFALQHKASVEEADQSLWKEFESSTPDVSLESRETIEVGGQSAIRRIFNAPEKNTPGGRGYMMQVYIVKELALYQITGWAPSADAFKQHQAEIDGIIASINFAP